MGALLSTLLHLIGDLTRLTYITNLPGILIDLLNRLVLSTRCSIRRIILNLLTGGTSQSDYTRILINTTFGSKKISIIGFFVDKRAFRPCRIVWMSRISRILIVYVWTTLSLDDSVLPLRFRKKSRGTTNLDVAILINSSLP